MTIVESKLVMQTSLLQQLRQAKPALFSRYPLKTLGLFGSHAREDAHPDSDVDILVEFEKPVGFEAVDLAIELEELLHLRVDLVSRKGVKASLWPFIEKDLIYV